MADRRRSRGRTAGPEAKTVTRATAIAEQLHHECSILLELYRKKEGLAAGNLVAAEGRLVSVPPLSSQLDAGDALWRLHSALLQCRSLLERAIAREEEELGGGKRGDYETQRKTVKERLFFLSVTTGELLKAVDGAAVPTPDLEGPELDGPDLLFEFKLWVYRIFSEVDHWTVSAIATLRGLHLAKELRPKLVRSTRSARR